MFDFRLVLLVWVQGFSDVGLYGRRETVEVANKGLYGVVCMGLEEAQVFKTA